MKSAFQGWSDVRVFLAVFRLGSTLAASKVLGMAQPTVARRIEALEHSLKLTLFDRDTRGFHPTGAARTVLPAAEAMEAAAADFEAAAQVAKNTDMRPIRLTGPVVNFSGNLAKILSDFALENPGVLFEMLATYDLLDLAAGEADVAIRIAKAVTDERLICRRLTTVTASLYASRGYAERYGLPSSPNDLDGHRFVLIKSNIQSMNLNNWLKSKLKPGQIVSQCSGVDSVLTAIKAGMGVGPIPTSLAVNEPDLVRCFPPPEGTEVYSWLLFSPEAWKRSEVKAFAAFFVPRYRALFKGMVRESD